MSNVKGRGTRTILAHAPQMGVDASFVFYKRLVTRFMFVYPIADVLAQLGMLGVGAVELVGEGAEETVAIAEGGCCVEA